MATQVKGLPHFLSTSQQWFFSGKLYLLVPPVSGRDGSKVNHKKLDQILAQEKQQAAATKHMLCKYTCAK